MVPAPRITTEWPAFLKDYAVEADGDPGTAPLLEHNVPNCISNVELGITYHSGTVAKLWYNGWEPDEEEKRDFPSRIGTDLLSVISKAIEHEEACRRYRDAHAKANNT